MAFPFVFSSPRPVSLSFSSFFAPRTIVSQNWVIPQSRAPYCAPLCLRLSILLRMVPNHPLLAPLPTLTRFSCWTFLFSRSPPMEGVFFRSFVGFAEDLLPPPLFHCSCRFGSFFLFFSQLPFPLTRAAFSFGTFLSGSEGILFFFVSTPLVSFR